MQAGDAVGILKFAPMMPMIPPDARDLRNVQRGLKLARAIAVLVRPQERIPSGLMHFLLSKEIHFHCGV
jgi:hypothetical protein